MFFVFDIFGVGYCLFWLCFRFLDLNKKLYIGKYIVYYIGIIVKKIENVNIVSLEIEKWVLENNLLWVKVEVIIGNLESIFDKIN